MVSVDVKHHVYLLTEGCRKAILTADFGGKVPESEAWTVGQRRERGRVRRAGVDQRLIATCRGLLSPQDLLQDETS